jgi:cytosine deaminase
MNSAPERLLLEGVTLVRQAGRSDIEVIGGRIAALTPSKARNGGVVSPLLADAHVHLDKTYTIERTTGRVDGLFDAIALVEDDMRQWTANDIRRRAGRALEAAYLNGVCALRSHVDWPKPDVPLAWAVLNELRQEWKGRIDLQLSSLMPADLLPQAGARIAGQVRQDNAVFGVFFYRNADLAAKVELAFRLASDNGLELDFHVDEGLDIEAEGFAEIVAATARYKMAGRVLCGHACSLSVHDHRKLGSILSAGAKAGVALVVLPTTNLYLQDRAGGHSPRRRGIAPVLEARNAGIEVMLGIDNCRDAFYPFGDYDPLAILRLAVLACHVDPAEWTDSITTLPAARCGVPMTPIAVGNAADFIWFDATDLGDLISRPAAERVVYRAGRKLAPAASRRESA